MILHFKDYISIFKFMLESEFYCKKLRQFMKVAFFFL